MEFNFKTQGQESMECAMSVPTLMDTAFSILKIYSVRENYSKKS
jgi:hypothetical protein